MINIWTSVCEIILLLYWCLLFFFLGQWNLVIQPVPSVLWSCCSLIQSFSIVVVSPLQAFAVPLRLQWFPVLFCPIFGHVPCPSGASTLPHLGTFSFHVVPKIFHFPWPCVTYPFVRNQNQSNLHLPFGGDREGAEVSRKDHQQVACFISLELSKEWGVPPAPANPSKSKDKSNNPFTTWKISEKVKSVFNFCPSPQADGHQMLTYIILPCYCVESPCHISATIKHHQRKSRSLT